MNVLQLIKELQDLPETAEVILSSDPEGNSYNTAYEVTLGVHWPNDDELWPVHPDDMEEGDEPVVAVYIYP